jgi:riboflavin kinase/FMN adenylyltransferase
LDEIIISSTKIREALLKSDIDTANGFLGYRYFFEGKVVEGNRLGRTIGYPTANLVIADDEKLIPGNGVYAVETIISGHSTRYKAMMNIGFRPTVNGTRRTIEVNIFDFDKDIYGETMHVYVNYFLRGEVKFAELDQLKEQLAIDKVHAQQKQTE